VAAGIYKQSLGREYIPLTGFRINPIPKPRLWYGIYNILQMPQPVNFCDCFLFLQVAKYGMMFDKSGITVDNSSSWSLEE